MKKILILAFGLSFNAFSASKAQTNSFMSLSGNNSQNKLLQVDQARAIGGHEFVIPQVSLNCIKVVLALKNNVLQKKSPVILYDTF